MTYETIVTGKGPSASKGYLDRFKEKLPKFMKGASDLAEERKADEQEEGADEHGQGVQG